MDFELKLIEFIQAGRTPFFDLAFQVISYVGSAVGIVTMAILLFIFRRKLCYCFLVTYGFVYLVNNVIVKNLVKRVRPFVVSDQILNIGDKVTDFSFPSGHIACAVTIAIFMGYFLFQYFKNLSSRLGIILCLVIYVGLVAISRMYLGKHYLTDLLAGMLIAGTISVIGLFVTYFYYKKKGLLKNENKS